MRLTNITYTACALAFGFAVTTPISAYAQIDPGNFAQLDPGDKVDPNGIAQIDPGYFAQVDPGDKVDTYGIAQVDPGSIDRVESYGELGYLVDHRRLSKVEVRSGVKLAALTVNADWSGSSGDDDF
jgi:hypothetical protein